MNKYNNVSRFISIHALVKRATTYMRFYLFLFGISIHALVKRATEEIVFVTGGFTDFNPRPREEGDFRSQPPFCIRSYFNPRPREEGD